MLRLSKYRYKIVKVYGAYRLAGMNKLIEKYATIFMPYAKGFYQARWTQGQTEETCTAQAQMLLLLNKMG